MTKTMSKRLEDATSRAGDLTHLLTSVLRFTSDSPSDAVVDADGREGEYVGSGDGSVVGPGLNGTMRWSLYSGNCLYPRIRKGESVQDDLHLCTLNPGGFIDTDSGACIRFDGKGYGLRSAKFYRVSMTLSFSTDDPRYQWLNDRLGVMVGEFDERAGRATWHIYVPA